MTSATDAYPQMNAKEVRPQKGPQEAFLRTSADIAVYGGAAFGGKTAALALEALRHVSIPQYRAILFRRVGRDIMSAGSLWDECVKFYIPFGAKPNKTQMQFEFPSGAVIQLRGMEHEDDKERIRGAQAAMMGFDEATQFEESQFWFAKSRLRSLAGVPTRFRLTCNPDPDSWVLKLIDWWIDMDVTGLPIMERAGKIRYLIRESDQLVFADDPREIWPEDCEFCGGILKNGKGCLACKPMSLTFIPAKAADNMLGVQASPEYIAGLRSLPDIEREQLKEGNWKIRRRVGDYFSESMFQITDRFPAGLPAVRYWDKAGSTTKGDYTAGVLLVFDYPYVVVADCVHGRWDPITRNRVIQEVAELDAQTFGINVDLWLEQEGASGGKESAIISVLELVAYAPNIDRPTSEQSRHHPTGGLKPAKEARCRSWSAFCGSGMVKIVRDSSVYGRGIKNHYQATTDWNGLLIREHCVFPNTSWHDDTVDAATGAFNKLTIAEASQSAFLPFAG